MAKLIALDLDGTLLRTDKTLSDRNRKVLEAAAAAGHYIVPCTGRFYEAMPAPVRELTCTEYAITINGAQIERIAGHQVLGGAGIEFQRAIEILTYIESRGAYYDCYAGNWAYTEFPMYEAMLDVNFGSEPFRNMVRDYKQPVADLKAFLQGRKDIWKVQAFLPDASVQAALIAELRERFPEMLVTFSYGYNIEINIREANKGTALCKLADYLGISHADTIAFGDSSNDLTMIREAGVGVAMGNALEEIRQAADLVTLDNDSDGVACALEDLLQL